MIAVILDSNHPFTSFIAAIAFQIVHIKEMTGGLFV